MALAAIVCLASAPSLAQQPPAHFIHPAGLPPGAIGNQQLQRGGPIPGFFQPVEIKAPDGVAIAMAEEGRFGEPQKAPIHLGLLIGQVYRMRLMNVPLQPGVEVFPTIEIVDRIYAPRGQELRFPITVEIDRDDLNQALSGKFVTRIVYLEDPERALPIQDTGKEQGWFDVPPGTDPLVVADGLGRPVAILRMGARVPERTDAIDMAFLYGCPPLVKYAPRAALPAAANAAAKPVPPPPKPGSVDAGSQVPPARSRRDEGTSHGGILAHSSRPSRCFPLCASAPLRETAASQRASQATRLNGCPSCSPRLNGAVRLLALALCMVTMVSCRGVDQPPERGGRVGMNGSPYPALPYSAHTGAPPAGAPGVQADAPPLPYSVGGPWAPPGLAQPWPQDEYLADGGDRGMPAGATKDGRVVGLDTQDTVAEYDTLDGRTLVEPSNRVYLYSPRFLAVRQVVSVEQNDEVEGSAGVHKPVRLAQNGERLTTAKNKQNLGARREIGQKSLTTFRTRQWDGVTSTAIGPRGFQDAFLPYENVAVLRTGKYAEAEMAWLARGVTAAITWSHADAVQVILDGKSAMEDAQVEKAEMTFRVEEPPARPKLRIIKVASTPFAEPGDVVDFTLRFDNIGNQPVGNVTIMDNLVTRLEYVAGIAQSSLPAKFSTQRNEAESLVLRWEITDPVYSPTTRTNARRRAGSFGSSAECDRRPA